VRPHRFVQRVEEATLPQLRGYVRAVAAGLIRASGPSAAPGSLCIVESGGDRGLICEVVAVDEGGIALMPLEPVEDVQPGAKVALWSRANRVSVGDGFGGRVIDALGSPLDGKGPILRDAEAPVTGDVPSPLDRAGATAPLATGLRAIDALLPLSVGQRVGIFAASGVGKTSLVEQLASQVQADRCVLCLVGERGREVEAMARFIRQRSDRSRFTLVSATSDESAAMRSRAVDYALSLAEHWRRQREHVLLIVDSVTRFAMALREVGLAAGAPPTVRAYTPNVFAALPRLVERCGALKSGGAITAVMTVLSETDDIDDPIVELMKSLLDGHIILSRSLAEQGHYPAIEVIRSISRGADRLVGAERAAQMQRATSLLAIYEEARIMIESGVYKSGSNPAVDNAMKAREPLLAFLRQQRDEASSLEETGRKLVAAIGKAAAHA
jgi:flagellum-specific ATP synthase